jgi:hypothetical protein
VASQSLSAGSEREAQPARLARRTEGSPERGGLAAQVLALQRTAGNQAVQRAIANSGAAGLTKNMTANFINRHILNNTASGAINPPDPVPPRLKPDGSYVRDKDWANTGNAYKQALNRFNNDNGNATHVLEIAQDYPEYAPGKRMNVARAQRPETGHVDMIVEAGWRFAKVAANGATPGLSENVGTVAQEAVLQTTSSSQRKARVGALPTQINHFPGDKNPFLH